MSSMTEPGGGSSIATLRRTAGKTAALLRRFWHSEFRKRRISWSRFREKRLTWRGFLTFDRNARLRTCIYLTILALNLAGWYGPASRPKLMRMACGGMEEATLPGRVFAVMGYERAMQVDALQDRLLAHYDADGDGRLNAREARRLTSETGLAPRDLAVSCVEGDLTRLVTAAHARRLLPERIIAVVEDAYELPPRIALRRLRRHNYDKALAEYERWRTAMWKEVEPHLTYRYAEAKDYLKWQTWRRGGERFYDTGKQLLMFAKR